MSSNHQYIDNNHLKEECSSNSIDKRVGERIRLRRRVLGFSQEKLALALGLSFQQIQKYEKGSNRVGASRLYDIAQILQVPINFFFDEQLNSLYTQRKISVSDFTAAMAQDVADILDEAVNNMCEVDLMKIDIPVDTQETTFLLKAFYSIKEPEVRQRLLHLMFVMGNLNKT